MSTTSGTAENRSSRWISLWADDRDRRLATLGLFFDRAAHAIVCTQCKYALKPSCNAVSKHLWEKHGTPIKLREGLNAFVKSLELVDPKKLKPLRDNCAGLEGMHG